MRLRPAESWVRAQASLSLTLDRFRVVIRPLPLRADVPPDDATVVLRAGLMADESVRRAATRTFEIYGVYGLSIEAVIGRSVTEACQTSERIANYRQVRLSTCGRLRGEGFALLASFEHPHFTLVLADLSELTIARLQVSFDAEIPNPGRASRG